MAMESECKQQRYHEKSDTFVVTTNAALKSRAFVRFIAQLIYHVLICHK